MNPIRKATPDSEAVASSEDERPWPSAPSFGTLPRKENGMPGLGGGIWSQKRGSFKMEKTAQRNAAREVRMATPTNPTHPALRAGSTPSPSASEVSATLPFAIPLRPVPKAGRSLSHSQGQREILQGTSRPDSRNHVGALPLGLLAEEVDPETEDELGGGLTQTTSYPVIGTLQRTSTYPSAYDPYYAPSASAKHASDAVERHNIGGIRSDRRLESALADLTIDQPPRRAIWQSHLGWDDVVPVNESRRHSLADIPTRRGSLDHQGSSPVESRFFDWNGNDVPPKRSGKFGEAPRSLQFGSVAQESGSASPDFNRSDPAAQMRYSDKDDQGRAIDIPSMYKVPFIRLADHERSETDRRPSATASTGAMWMGGPGRPRKVLYIVSFKCSRVDVFYLLDNTGLTIKEGDIVIVEADRGQDLGTVQHANVSPDDARLYKKKYGEEQYKWLMMFSRNNAQGNVNPNAQIYGENAARSNLLANAPATMQGLPRDNFNNLKPKAIKRLASSHEIRMLAEKEGNEAKAKRTCQQKVAHLHLDMEILDAEWQWDFQKLIYYYYADHYINFKDLITELYRIYKTRIWLSAINPASFSHHALGQPPSGIGPGAVSGYNPQLNNTYTMMYGPDPDPYGAVPPYRIGYDTYTPNYPGIPGVANSFAPQGAAGYPTYGSNGEAAPSLPPGVTSTGTPADYNYYYDRSGAVEEDPHVQRASHQQAAFAGMPPASQYFSPTYGPSSGPPGHSSSTSNDRSPYGYGAGYLNTPGHTNGNGSTAPALGRSPWFPSPIGTRPGSNGHVTQTSNGNARTSMSEPHNGSSFAVGTDPLRRAVPDFVPGQQLAQQPPFFLQGASSTAFGSNSPRSNLGSAGMPTRVLPRKSFDGSAAGKDVINVSGASGTEEGDVC